MASSLPPASSPSPSQGGWQGGEPPRSPAVASSASSMSFGRFGRSARGGSTPAAGQGPERERSWGPTRSSPRPNSPDDPRRAAPAGGGTTVVQGVKTALKRMFSRKSSHAQHMDALGGGGGGGGGAGPDDMQQA